MSDEKGTLRIWYTNGTEQIFEFEPAQADQVRIASRLEKLLDAHYVVIELEQKALFIPTSSIQSIEVSPVPEKLPDITIRNARLIK